MLITSLSIIGIISAHILLYIDAIPVEIFIAAIDVLFVLNLLYYVWCKRKMLAYFQKRKKWKVPLRPSPFPTKIKNKYLTRWKDLKTSRAMLPLNRIAFLKARYKIGPFLYHKYANEVSISYLKSEAEKSYLRKPWDDECHPKCYVTDTTESYVQYKAVLYCEQGMDNVDEKHQWTCPSDELHASPSSESGLPRMPSRRYTMAPVTMKEQEELESMIQQNLEDLSESQKWEEFQREVDASRKKMEDVRFTFKLMKRETARLHSENDTDSSSVTQ